MSRMTVRHNINGRPERLDFAPEISLAGGWTPTQWLGAPAPGRLALLPAHPTMVWRYSPRGAFVSEDVLVVADPGNHGVLIWHSLPTEDHQPADAGDHRVLGWSPQPDGDAPAVSVLGQPGFDTVDEWPYGPHSSERFRFPYAIGPDGKPDGTQRGPILWRCT